MAPFSPAATAHAFGVEQFLLVLGDGILERPARGRVHVDANRALRDRIRNRKQQCRGGATRSPVADSGATRPENARYTADKHPINATFKNYAG